MTVHRAKGLEFDTVFLPFLDWDPISRLRSRQQPYLLERVPGAGDHFLLAVHPDHLRGEPDPLFKWLSGLQAGRVWGEAKRLFYVAVTRARNKLKMSGLVPLKRSDTGLSLSSRTPLSWLDTRFGISEGMDFSAVRHPDETASEIPGDWNREWENERDGFRVLMEPWVPAEAEPAREDFKPVEIHPAPFERERPSFRTSSPSSLVSGEEGEDEGEGSGSEGTAGSTIPRLRGVLIHRLLANYARNRKLPPSRGSSQASSMRAWTGILPPGWPNPSCPRLKPALQTPGSGDSSTCRKTGCLSNGRSRASTVPDFCTRGWWTLRPISMKPGG